MRRFLAAGLALALALQPGAEAYAHGGGRKSSPARARGGTLGAAAVLPPCLPTPILTSADLGGAPAPSAPGAAAPASAVADAAPPAAPLPAWRRAGRAALSYSGLAGLGRLLSYGNTVEKWADELSDPRKSPEERLAAARRLYDRAAPETIEVLGAASVADPDPAVREAARAGVLAVSARHAPRFLRELRYHPLAGRRASAARALGWIARHDASVHLVDALAFQAAADSKTDARLAAVEALSTAASLKSLERLAELLKKAETAALHSAIQLALLAALKRHEQAGRAVFPYRPAAGEFSAGKQPLYQSALKKVIGVSAFFLAVEALGGWYTGSLSLKADATHMAADLSINVGALVALWLARRPASSRRTYGYLKVEPVMGLVSALVIAAMAVAMGFEAVARFATPAPVPGLLTMGLALAGLASNIVATLLLYRYREDNLSLKGAFLHAATDALGSVGVILGGLLIWGLGWTTADPIISLGIVLLILKTVWSLAKASWKVLIDSVPDGVVLEEVEADLLAVPGAAAVSDLHVWSLNSSETALTAVLHIRPDADYEAALSAAKAVAVAHGVTHATIQVERLAP